MKLLFSLLSFFFLHSAIALTPCASNKDCLETQYCAAGECLDHSACKTDADCFNPSNIFSVITCVGYIECQENGICGMVCDETASQCKDGSDYVNCFAAPCSVDSGCDDAVSCVDDYCGGCNTIHFDAAGNQVCADDVKEPTVVVDMPTSCKTDKDCAVSSEIQKSVMAPFCAQGVCMEAGSCQTDLDCFNPSNVYPVAACLGYIECQENGLCGIVCGGDIGTPTSCETDKDCAVSSEIQKSVMTPFCAQGVCMEAGSCQTDLDCFNPSNVYPVDECLGYIECQENGMCGIVCDGADCKGGSDYVNCFAAPCSVDSGCDDAVSCFNDYCGGCNATHFDAAGNQACEKTTFIKNTDESCNCLDEQYCADGTCLDFSTCQKVSDCLNPENNFLSIACVGSFQCEGGQCNKICDEDPLPDESSSGDDDSSAYIFRMACMLWFVFLVPIMLA